jgi:putative alpha-1,2-mannosidase
VAGNINAFIDRHKHNGYVATAFIQGREMTVGQGGDEMDNIIADAYVKGVRGVNWTNAYAVQKYNADIRRTPDYKNQGYVSTGETTGYGSRMKSGSSTLAFAYNDFCVAQVAKGLGFARDYKTYAQRAGNWTNVWDATLADDGFSGFVRGRHHDGSFTATEANGGYNKDFYEGTCWIYSYFVPQDLPGLIRKMGGTNTFVQRLSRALKKNLIDFSNEPSFNTIWWFDAVNRPDLAAYWANQLRKKFTATGYPGDEDSGAMSSLYIFLTSGMFPIAGQDIYYLHGPRFGRMTFHLKNGKDFTIIGNQTSANHIYVQSAALNGVPLSHPWIHHTDITNGGTLEFTMGGTASSWGTATHRNDADSANVLKSVSSGSD